MSERERKWNLFLDPTVATLVFLLVTVTLVGLLASPIGWLWGLLQPVLMPVVVALAAAYVLNPLVSWVEARSSVSRGVITGGVLLIIGMLILSVVLYLTPMVLQQVADLIDALPRYAGRTAEWLAARLNTDVEDLEQRLVERVRELIASLTSEGEGDRGRANVGALLGGLLQGAGMGVGVVMRTIGIVTYLGVALGVGLFSLFVFLWRFDEVMAVVPPLVPASVRLRFLELAGQMDKAVSAVIRGRLFQSLIYGSVLSAGWALAGVPYFLLLGVAGGIFNLVPFLGAVVWPVAVLLALADSGVDAGWLAPLLWPTLVYLVAVFIDSWIVEPWVQGSATNLGPLTIMLVVLTGAALMGVVGMLLAIPAAACVRVLLSEEILPRLRNWAEST
ncbi:AI-2E family transporter [Mucisphaera calidilacus]|uniref:AI-2E family transporter n=1 Tax=Mucisphaera calidilacus TaxID=2527982 RepID=A0A518BYZ8_9BACT|nr:AI-2E family transporter [Mucisphaera calidilacus]QDU72201.1 hypothetical protein Pan265_20640 [Mucisphaera calidilacus]